jgi:hypothetical protein
MKKIKVFKLTYCGFCREALRFLEEAMAANPAYRKLEIEIIDEAEQRGLARSHDYYYVPTFYVDNVKVHEGPVCRGDVDKILKQALDQP